MPPRYLKRKPTRPEDRPSRLLLAAIIALSVLCGCQPRDSTDPADLPELPPLVAQTSQPRGPELAPRRLTLALVGEVRGEIDPCGCPDLPIGGFERRAGLLDELRAEGHPLFHLDAGHLLVSGFRTGGRGDRVSRAELLLDLSQQVGLDAWCPSPADLLALDLTTLEQEAGRRKLNIVSATWLDDRGAALLPPAAVLTRGGVKLGVIGLSAPPSDPALHQQMRQRDSVEGAQAAVDDLPADLDLVVALSNLSDEENDRVAEEVSGLAALLTTRNAAYDEPRSSGEGLIVEVPNRGRHVSVLRTRLATEAHRSLDLQTAERCDLDTHDQVAAKVARLQRAEGGAVPERDLQALAVLQDGLRQHGAGRNLAYMELVPLGTRYVGDQASRERIARFKREILQETIDELAQVSQEPSSPPRYVSSSGCYSCHTEHYTRWTLTKHTQAYEALLTRGEERNPECLTCHSTGFGVSGGWAELIPANLRKFKAVQCEACHGPLERHPHDPEVRPARPGVELCESCHDEANSPAFDYHSYLPRGSCVETTGLAPVTGSAQAGGGAQDER